VIILVVVGGGGYVAMIGGKSRFEPTATAPAAKPSTESKATEEAEKLSRERAVLDAEKNAIEEQKSKLAAVASQGTFSATSTTESGTTEALGPDAIISRMLDASVRNADAEIKDLKIQGDGLPKPARGDRKLARALNSDAMGLLNESKYSEAVAILKKASVADPADVEIVDNLGYAALKAGNLDEAKRSSYAALAIAPGRSSAWASLGVVLAQTATEAQAVASFANAYRFSGNTAKTMEYLGKLAADDPNPKVQSAAAKTLDVIKTSQ
jgi:tetratricopeptide (TPR) repeat protein